MPTSASCLSVRSLCSSPGKTTKVGWRGLGAAEQPSTRSARTKGCQGFMVRVAVSGCSCPCGGFKEALSNESVTPPLPDRPGRELTQGMVCACVCLCLCVCGVCVCVCVGQSQHEKAKKGLTPPPPLPPAHSPHCRVRQDPRPTGNHRPIGEGLGFANCRACENCVRVREGGTAGGLPEPSI